MRMPAFQLAELAARNLMKVCFQSNLPVPERSREGPELGASFPFPLAPAEVGYLNGTPVFQSWRREQVKVPAGPQEPPLAMPPAASAAKYIRNG